MEEEQTEKLVKHLDVLDHGEKVMLRSTRAVQLEVDPSGWWSYGLGQ